MAPLTSTNELIKEYGNELINGTISDKRLSALMQDERFSRSSTYNAFDPVTDSNHSVLDSLRDFVATIGPQIPLAIFHQLTIQLITPAVEALENVDFNHRDTLMRNSTLDKIFLSYEFAHNKASAKTHFEEGGILYEFQSPTNEANLKSVLLSVNVSFFESFKGQVKAAEEKERTELAQDIIATCNSSNTIEPTLKTQVISLTQKLMANPSKALIEQFQDLTEQVKTAEATLSDPPSKKSQNSLSWLMEGFIRLCCRLLAPFRSITGEKEVIPKKLLSDIMEKYVPKLEDRGSKPDKEGARI